MDGIDAFKWDLVQQPLEVPLAAPEPVSGDGGPSVFGEMLTKWMDKTNTTIQESDQTVQALIDGTLEHPHEAMIALEKAHLSLQMTVQMRNKMVEAYNEIMRMQV